MNERLTVIRRGRKCLRESLLSLIVTGGTRSKSGSTFHRRKVIPSSEQNPAGARISPGPVGDSQKLQPESEPRGPFEDTLIDNPSRHTTPEPTGKMKYIHSEETLEIPEGGTVDLLRRL